MNNFKCILFFLISLSMTILVSSCGAKGDLYHAAEPEKTESTPEDQTEKSAKTDESIEKKPQ